MLNEREKYLSRIAKTTAELIHYACAWNEAMDGDETLFISQEVLKELDQLNGNKFIERKK